MSRQIPPTAQADDSDLMKGVAAGERHALRTLYERHGPRAVAVAQGICRSNGEAEEIVQEVFLEVWKRAGEYNPHRGSVCGWLLVMVRRRAIDRLRTTAVAQRAAQRDPFHGSFRTEDVATPLELAEQKQARQRVQLALEQLPAEQRRVVQLGYFEGLSQREIAEMTGDPIGTVKTRIRIAMQKLGQFFRNGKEESGT